MKAWCQILDILQDGTDSVTLARAVSTTQEMTVSSGRGAPFDEGSIADAPTDARLVPRSQVVTASRCPGR